MRIWILTSELVAEVNGGIARYVDTFARLLGAAGHQVLILGPSAQARDENLAPHVRLVTFAPGRPLGGAGPNAANTPPAYPYDVLAFKAALSHQMADEVLRLLRDEPPPDVIESQEFGALPYYLLQRKLVERTPLERIPILVHLHGPLFELLQVNQEPRYILPDYWIGQMEKACVRMADALLAPGDFLSSRIEQQLCPDRPIARIPYPVSDLPVGAPAPGQPGELLYVGRLQLLKGVLPLLQSCRRMWAEGQDFRLTMIGADTRFTPRNVGVRAYIERHYEAQIAAGRLRLLGSVPYATLLAELRRAWALVLPSLWDNFPLVCIEALNLGQVVLASRSGGQAELVADNEQYGFLFDWQQPGDFDRQLRRVLALSEAERQAMAHRAQQRVRSYCDPAVVLPLRVQHYESLVAQHQSRTRYPAPADGRPPVFDRTQPAALADGEVKGLLSVIVPYYNLGEFLPDTLRSIACSTYAPREVIVVNDGSTDAASLALLEKLRADPSAPVRIVDTLNQGLAATRNTGADHARGEFICFLDADDCVEPEYFARAIDVLQRYDNVDFVYSWLRCFGGATHVWPTWDAELPYLLAHNMATAFAVQRHRSFLRWGRNRPAVAYALEDFEMWISMVSGGAVGVSLPQPLVNYRIRSDSMLQTSHAAQQVYLYDLITELHAELYQRWGVALFNLQNANGPGWLWNHPGAMTSVITPAQLAEMRAWVRDLESARDWLEQQRAGFEAQTHEQAASIQELRAWVDRLEQDGRQHERAVRDLQNAREWLQQQIHQRDAHAAQQEQAIAELRTWAKELEKAKQWHVERAQQLESDLQQTRAACEAWKRQGVIRILRRLRILQDLRP